ncbi:hypothetical protein SK128_016520 [Halocaridina rubra]|uniref:Prokaryotic-type class I peptide chain release factors domain-containing protein n=1 Tax=Halocaridina rubra TaxID=373956 RepID=A0AAN8WUY3_HALRR
MLSGARNVEVILRLFATSCSRLIKNETTLCKNYGMIPSNFKKNYSNTSIGLLNCNKTSYVSWHWIGSKNNVYTSTIKDNKKIDKSRVPTLDENDLEESFVRGSGPGGQSVNKTASACHLKHIPTGFVVKCHEFRSLIRNRQRAREILIDKLDQHFNGEMSVASQTKRLQDERSNRAQQKARKKQIMKDNWKEREGIK